MYPSNKCVYLFVCLCLFVDFGVLQGLSMLVHLERNMRVSSSIATMPHLASVAKITKCHHSYNHRDFIVKFQRFLLPPQWSGCVLLTGTPVQGSQITGMRPCVDSTHSWQRFLWYMTISFRDCSELVQPSDSFSMFLRICLLRASKMTFPFYVCRRHWGQMRPMRFGHWWLRALGRKHRSWRSESWVLWPLVPFRKNYKWQVFIFWIQHVASIGIAISMLAA